MQDATTTLEGRRRDRAEKGRKKGDEETRDEIGTNQQGLGMRDDQGSRTAGKAITDPQASGKAPASRDEIELYFGCTAQFSESHRSSDSAAPILAECSQADPQVPRYCSISVPRASPAGWDHAGKREKVADAIEGAFRKLVS